MLEYTSLVNFVIWVVILLFSSIVQNRYVIYKNLKEKIKTVIIIVFTYFIIYLLFGLFFGFKKSPYSLTFNSIINNLFLIVGTIAIQEYIRVKLIINNNSFGKYVFITIIFILLKLNFHEMALNFVSLEKAFEYTLSNIIPLLVSNILLAYLSITGGYLLNFSFSLPFALSRILLPVFPNLNWFLDSSMLLICYVVISIFMHHENIKSNHIHSDTYTSPLKTIPLIFLLLLFISFVAGFFIYKPIAIISNSMVPAFSRGDIVICKKVSNFDTINIEDIIEYEFNDSYILHRVVAITEDIDGNLLFTTKGDNNNLSDQNFVTSSQIVGVVKYSIPYLGYPTVLFTELILSFSQ